MAGADRERDREAAESRVGAAQHERAGRGAEQAAVDLHDRRRGEAGLRRAVDGGIAGHGGRSWPA